MKKNVDETLHSVGMTYHTTSQPMLLLLRKFSFLLVFCCVFPLAYAQQVVSKVDSLLLSTSDSLKTRYTGKPFASLDSLKGKLDSLSRQKLQQLHSVPHTIQQRLDSIKYLPLSTLSRLHLLDSLTDKASHPHLLTQADSLVAAWQARRDSLRAPTDSLQKRLLALREKIKQKTAWMDSLSTPFTEIPGNLKPTSLLPDPSLSELTTRLNLSPPAVPGLNGSTALPSWQLPHTELPQTTLPGMALPDKLSDLSAYTQNGQGLSEKLPSLGTTKDGKKIMGSIPTQLQVHQETASQLMHGNTQERWELAQEQTEKAATQIQDVQALKQQTDKATGTLQQYQDMADKLGNEETLKQEAKQEAQQQLPEQLPQTLTDHFAGQQEKLQAAMQEINKLKTRYTNVLDSRNLPKKEPDALKGRPLRERLVPGFTLQYFKTQPVLHIDLSPYVAYRFTEKLRAGAGATYRFNLTEGFGWVDQYQAWGMRGFANYTVWKGFSVHAEGTAMHTVPYNPKDQSSYDAANRQWLWVWQAGILKQYKVTQRISGTAQALYNFSYAPNGLYANRFTVRVGLEWNFKKDSSSK